MYKERLEALISGYREQAKPLMDDMYVRLGFYPENCLNEIRAMLDHVSRCYRVENSHIPSSKKETIYNEELSKAEGHLRRLLYDIFKQLNILLYDAIHQKENTTYSSRWLYIDGGKFWLTYTSKLQEAMESVVEAKKNESYDPDKAMKYYDKSYNAYCAAEQLLVNHRKELMLSQFLKYLEIVNNWFVWLSVTIVLSFLSALISIIF